MSASDRVKVKICGIRTPKEAGWLSEEGADYAGFVFFEKSKRNITHETAAECFKELSSGIKKVAVLVSPSLVDIKRICDRGFDIIQIHGELKDEVLEAAELPVWRAVNISSCDGITVDITSEKIAAVLVDAENFGAGKTFDWKSSAGLKEKLSGKPFVLAGGLNPDNVKRGIEIFDPDIVDVSSGVENADGTGKDREKIRDFIAKVGR